MIVVTEVKKKTVTPMLLGESPPASPRSTYNYIINDSSASTAYNYIINDSSASTAESMLEKLFENIKIAEKHMNTAQQTQEKFTNRKPRDIEFKEGEKVLLSTNDLHLKGTITPKLTAKFIGPFVVKKVLSPLNYELSLPSSLPIHPVFHISKLRKFINSDESFPNRVQEPNRPLPEIADEHEEYEVEAIRAHRFSKCWSSIRYALLISGYSNDEIDIGLFEWGY